MTKHRNRILEIRSDDFKRFLHALDTELDYLVAASEEGNAEEVYHSRERLEGIYQKIGSTASSRRMLRKIRSRLGFPGYSNGSPEGHINSLLLAGYQNSRN